MSEVSHFQAGEEPREIGPEPPIQYQQLTFFTRNLYIVTHSATWSIILEEIFDFFIYFRPIAIGIPDFG